MTDALAAAILEELRAIRTAGRSDRLTLSKAEAADSLGVSVDHFERHVQPELRVIRSGRKVLVPTTELSRWADQAAAATLERKPR